MLNSHARNKCVKHIPHVPENVLVPSVWTVGLVGLADTVVDRDRWYVITEEAVVLKLSLFVLAMDEVVGIRVP